jgi:hypothetical protein
LTAPISFTLTLPATSSLALPVFAGTPVPHPVTKISADTAGRAEQLARWGKGPIMQVAWSSDGGRLVVAFLSGVVVYDPQTLTEISSI